MRQDAEMTQFDLAVKSGLSPAVISQIETGRITSPQLDTLEKLAAALDCDLSTIVAAVKASTAEGTAA